ncbi:hypothetical protein NSQ20_11615 [Paenibacillus sp. FSL K6-1122]|uniref:hypothetical protein n=1 Tax=Paenibacillus sp. FSL K6-1122 TaxID=2954512 RepID=UPI0030ECB281
MPTTFYVNTNPLFSTDKIQICKKCISDHIGSKESNGYEDRIKSVLAIMDKPFIYDAWVSSDRDWSKYIPQISSLSHYKGKTFSDSVFNSMPEYSASDDLNEYSEAQVTLNDDEKNKYVSFWGKGYEIDDYLYLENEYETLLSSYECDSYAQEMLFQEIAHEKLSIRKAREANKPTEKLLKTLQELLGSSNIKPVQETGANATEQATFGTLIKKYENERPVPEPDPMWADVDGIKKYVQIWFLGHLCRMLGINNEYAQMYEDEISKYKVDAPEYVEDDETVNS